MKRTLLFCAALCITALSPVTAQEKKEGRLPGDEPIKIKIIKIIDGDTTIIEREASDRDFMSHRPHRPGTHQGKFRREGKMPNSEEKMKNDSCPMPCKMIIKCFGEDGNLKCDTMECGPGKMKRRPFNDKPGEYEDVRIIKTPDGKTKKITRKTTVIVEEIDESPSNEKVKPTSSQDLKLYPNPSKGKFTIEGEGPTIITVSDQSGKEIYKEEIKSEGKFIKEIDLGNNRKGTYLIRTAGKIGDQVKKIVIE